MRMAIWMFLTENHTKAELGRTLGVSRQHISRTINDFLQKNAQKLFT
ncbi:MAG: helix-turn-helix of DDE superfamily endonuclease [Caudovirales sp. ctOwN3]|nr:MAG: helix-turn-helix of DDE superfamily endonuclease [Caudovirales sp. ctOwN3]